MGKKNDLLKEIEECFWWQRRTRYHEAGHAVALYIHKFRPRVIDGDICELTRARWLDGTLHTCRARERAADLAVCCIAGIVAEGKACDLSMVELRVDTGRGDYDRVKHLAWKTSSWLNQWELSDEVIDSQIALWEARTITLFTQPAVWNSVECVVAELDNNDGYLGGKYLMETINRGLCQQETVQESPWIPPIEQVS